MADKRKRVERDPMRDNRRALTTGQVARVLGISRRSVTVLCESGKLLSWRVGSRAGGEQSDRRVDKESVVAYCRAAGIPLHCDLYHAFFVGPVSDLHRVGQAYTAGGLSIAFGSPYAAAHRKDAATLFVIDGAGVPMAEACRLAEFIGPGRCIAVMPEDVGDVAGVASEFAGKDLFLTYIFRPIDPEHLAAFIKAGPAAGKLASYGAGKQ